MRMQQIADLRGFAARQQLKDELAYYQDGMGMSCQASGNGGTCGFKASNKSIQQAMSGAFALARGLDIAGEAIAVVTPLGDGVEIVDAIVEGDDAALAMAVGMAVVGLVPGVKGAKAAKKIADVADGAHDAAKAADALGGAAKAAKGGDGSVVFHRYGGDAAGTTGRHVTAEVLDASGKSLGEFHQTGIRSTTIERATDFAGRTPAKSPIPRGLSDPAGAAEFGGSGFDAGRYRPGTNDCVTGVCAVGNAGSRQRAVQFLQTKCDESLGCRSGGHEHGCV